MYKTITISGEIKGYYYEDTYSYEHQKALDLINKEIHEAGGGKIVNIITNQTPLDGCEGNAGYTITSVFTYVLE